MGTTGSRGTFNLHADNEEEIIKALQRDFTDIEYFNSLIPDMYLNTFKHSSTVSVHFKSFVQSLRGKSIDNLIGIVKILHTDKGGSREIKDWLNFLENTKENSQEAHQGAVQQSTSTACPSLTKPSPQIDLISRLMDYTGLEIESSHFPACANPTENPCEVKQHVCWLLAESSRSLTALSESRTCIRYLEDIHNHASGAIQALCNRKKENWEDFTNSLQLDFVYLFNFFRGLKRSYEEVHPPPERFIEFISWRVLNGEKDDNIIRVIKVALDSFAIISNALGFDSEGILNGEKISFKFAVKASEFGNALKQLENGLKIIIASLEQIMMERVNLGATSNSEKVIHWFKNNNFAHDNFVKMTTDVGRDLPHNCGETPQVWK